jgi:hypothetical protein
VLAAPLTFNTINKWASGINDTVGLGPLNEVLSSETTIVAVPCVKPAFKPIRHMRPTWTCLKPQACGSSKTRS